MNYRNIFLTSLPYTFINPIEDQWVIDGMGGIFEGVCEGSQAVSEERKKESVHGFSKGYGFDGMLDKAFFDRKSAGQGHDDGQFFAPFWVQQMTGFPRKSRCFLVFEQAFNRPADFVKGQQVLWQIEVRHQNQKIAIGQF